MGDSFDSREGYKRATGVSGGKLSSGRGARRDGWRRGISGVMDNGSDCATL